MYCRICGKFMDNDVEIYCDDCKRMLENDNIESEEDNSLEIKKKGYSAKILKSAIISLIIGLVNLVFTVVSSASTYTNILLDYKKHIIIIGFIFCLIALLVALICLKFSIHYIQNFIKVKNDSMRAKPTSSFILGLINVVVNATSIITLITYFSIIIATLL